MIPSPTELSYFIEVANAENLSRAAQKLGISQPSLSISMQRIEKNLSVKLFIRHKKGMVLTKAGKILLLHAKQLLQEWETIKPQILAPLRQVQGQISIGCNVSVALYCLSDILKKNLLHYPKLEIQLLHAVSRHITECVIDLSIDIGIVVNPIKHPDLIIHKLGEDEFKLWSSVQKNKLNDLDGDEAVIICDGNLAQSQWMLKQLKKKKINYKRVIYTTSLELVAQMTMKACGVGILPARVVNALYPKQLSSIGKMPIYLEEICLIYRSENKNVMAIQQLVQSIKEYFSGI